MSLKVSIDIIEGPDKEKSLELSDKEVVIGRSKADLRISDKKVSGRHCKIYAEDDKVYLEDLGSTNGTFLGSKKVSKRIELKNLDVVTIGLTRIRLSIVEALEDFKANNSAEAPLDSKEASTETSAPKIPEDSELPPDDAEYRTTGIHRIEDMIKDEMGAFSKWDQPGVEDANDQRLLPKIQVSLVARKASEGLTHVNCSQEKTTLGRKDVDVRINDLDLSRQHCAIEIVAGTKAFVRDLASTNGTFVNGSKISYQEIKNGDLIQIGQSVFEVQIETI